MQVKYSTNYTLNMKNIFLVLFVCLCGTSMFAQDLPEEERSGFQKERLFVGGNFGLAFGDYTLIDVSPQIGYRFSNLFAAGLGLNFQYVSTKQRTFSGSDYMKTSQGVTGLNLFARLYPIQQIMLQVQPEANYIFGKQIYYGPPQEEYKMDAMIVPILLVGGGAVIPSGRGAFIASVFYDVLQNTNSPYGARPIYKFGFNFGL